MWKGIAAGTVALALAGSTLVYAQHRDRGYHGGERWRPTVEDMRAFGEARLAGLKAGLMLTPEQEKNWPTFESAARDYGKLRLEQRATRRNTLPTNDPAERLRQRATSMADTGAVLKRLADATDPLYKSLDDSQKRRFAILGRLGGERQHFRGRRGHDGPHGFGPRRTGVDEGFQPQGEMRL